MIIILIFISVCFTGAMSFMQLHKVLRNNRNYKILIVFSALLPFTLLLDDITSKKDIANSLVALSPICYLIVYKIFDKQIMSKYNRHIYFYKKYSTDQESVESTWQEFLYQFFLFLIPFFLIGIGKMIYIIIIK